MEQFSDSPQAPQPSTLKDATNQLRENLMRLEDVLHNLIGVRDSLLGSRAETGELGAENKSIASSALTDLQQIGNSQDTKINHIMSVINELHSGIGT